MARERVRITVDGLVIEVLKNGERTYHEYNSEIEALNSAKTLIETEITERTE